MKMEDLVISVVKNCDWGQLKVYAVSLQRSGFQGKRLMFVDGITPLARSKLQNYGFELMDFKVVERKARNRRPNEPFCAARWAPVVDFLRDNYSKFRYVIWTDVRDVVFQSDPAAWLEANLLPHRVLGASECNIIKNNPEQNEWLRSTVNKDDYSRIREYECCCGGTLAGDAETVYQVASKIYEVLQSGTPEAVDQGALNYVLHTSPINEIVRIPKLEEGFALTCSWVTDMPYWKPLLIAGTLSPIYDKSNGLVYASNGKLFSIVHQYDRDPVLRIAIEKRFQERVLIAITSCVRDANNGANQAMRDTFLKDVSNFPGLEYRFFIGDGTPTGEDESALRAVRDYFPAHAQKSEWLRNSPPPSSYIPLDDEILLSVPDDYQHTAHKTKEKLRWALSNGFDYIFQCFTDTYIDLQRLMSSGFDTHDYTGKLCNWPQGFVGAKGGQGYWLSRKAARFVLDQPVDDWAEDRWIASIMQRNNIPLHKVSRYEDYPVSPQATNNCITSHLAETPKIYDPKLMYEVHKLNAKNESAPPSAQTGYTHTTDPSGTIPYRGDPTNQRRYVHTPDPSQKRVVPPASPQQPLPRQQPQQKQGYKGYTHTPNPRYPERATPVTPPQPPLPQEERPASGHKSYLHTPDPSKHHPKK